MTVVWNFPTRIVFGAGSLAGLADEAKQLGAKRALIVTDPGVARAGLLERATSALDGGGVSHATFDAISTNPTETARGIEYNSGSCYTPGRLRRSPHVIPL